MSSHYGYGRRKELQLAEFLARRGFDWERATGSRGPVDVMAQKGRRRLAIQVKATRSDLTRYTRLSQRDETRLIRSAAARRAKAALALVSRNYVWIVSVPTEKRIIEGELRPLRYEYQDEA